jgi:hypothetical protein
VHAAAVPPSALIARQLLRARRWWRTRDGSTLDESRRRRRGATPAPPAVVPRLDAPAGLGVFEPWYPRRGDFLWHELPPPAGGCRGDAACAAERILLAPSWLVSLENGLGHKLKHVRYGASPPPAAFVHFTCVHQSENARAWPMRLFGHWRDQAADDPAGGVAGAVAARTRLLGLEGGTLAAPMRPRPWPLLNLIDAVLGGAAELTRRRLALPALNCTGVDDGRLPLGGRSGGLASRCFWHTHSAEHGTRCVFRVGGCPEADLATPTELEVALRTTAPPPVVSIDLRSGEALGTQLAAAALLLERVAEDASVVLLRLALPTDAESAPTARQLSAAVGDAGAPARFGRALGAFDRRCRELTRRRPRDPCTNICS